MATDIDLLVSQKPTKTKLHQVGLTPLKQISQKLVPQSASLCGMRCPLCSGACGLNSGHSTRHQCNLNSSHMWGAGTDVPGPH